MPPRSSVLACAFALRAGLVAAAAAAFYPRLAYVDSPAWFTSALAIEQGDVYEGVAGTFWPPLFKLVLAGVFALAKPHSWTPAVLNLLLGLAAILLVHELARRLYGETAAAFAALLCAAVPEYALLSWSSLAEPLFILLALAHVYAYARFRERPDEEGWHMLASVTGAAAAFSRYEGGALVAAFWALEFARLRAEPSRERRLREGIVAVLPALALAASWQAALKEIYGYSLAWMKVTEVANAADPDFRLPVWRLLLRPFENAAVICPWALAAVPWALWACRKDGARETRLPLVYAAALLAGLCLVSTRYLASADRDRGLVGLIALLLPLLGQGAARLSAAPAPAWARAARPALLVAALGWLGEGVLDGVNRQSEPPPRVDYMYQLADVARALAQNGVVVDEPLSCDYASRTDASCVIVRHSAGLLAWDDGAPTRLRLGLCWRGTRDPDGYRFLLRRGRYCLYRREVKPWR